MPSLRLSLTQQQQRLRKLKGPSSDSSYLGLHILATSLVILILAVILAIKFKAREPLHVEWHAIHYLQALTQPIAVMIFTAFGIFIFRNKLIAITLFRDTQQGFSPSQKLAYKLDYLFSTKPYTKLVSLAFMTILMIIFSGFLIFVTSLENAGSFSLQEALWRATHGVGLDWTFLGEMESTSFLLRLVGVITNVGGLVITTLLLGLVSDGIATYLHSLRRGSSSVIEIDHTLIIGWSPKLLSIIEQLSKANLSEGGGVVVVLAEKDKEEMEDEIINHDFKFITLGTRVVCRSGSALNMNDLRKVSHIRARSIIVLAENEDDPGKCDAKNLQILLSLMTARKAAKKAREEANAFHVKRHNQKDPPSTGYFANCPIVVEVLLTESTRLAKLVGENEVHPVVSRNVMARLMLQAARQPLVADVWESVLGFDNDEIYAQEWPELVNMSWNDVFLSFDDATPFGLIRNGRTILNPDGAEVIRKGDEIIVLAEDNDSYQVNEKFRLPDRPYHQSSIKRKLSRQFSIREEHILFCGWKDQMTDIIRVLDQLSEPNSHIWILCDVPVETREQMWKKDGLDVKKDLVNIHIEHRVGDPSKFEILQSLPFRNFKAVVIPAPSQSEWRTTDCDAKMLVSLLYVNAIITTTKATKGADLTVVAEVLDGKSQLILAESNLANAVIPSNEFISRALAMVSESAFVNEVLAQIFDPKGVEIILRKASSYVELGESLCFFEIGIRCRANEETLLGYVDSSGLNLNPKNKREEKRWAATDTLILLSKPILF